MRYHLIAVCLSLAIAAVRADQALPAWPAELSNDRRALMETALAFPNKDLSVPYKPGSADATGMDCSGAIFFLVKQAGEEPPRSAHPHHRLRPATASFHFRLSRSYNTTVR